MALALVYPPASYFGGKESLFISLKYFIFHSAIFEENFLDKKLSLLSSILTPAQNFAFALATPDCNSCNTSRSYLLGLCSC